MRQSKGFFTLIELLIVIAIIAILAAMLLPALNATRDKARAITCLNQLKQLNYAFSGYLSDNNDMFMPYWDSGATANKPNIVRVLVTGSYAVPKMFLCPGNTKRDPAITRRFTQVAVKYFNYHNNLGTAQDCYPDYGYNFNYLGRTNAVMNSQSRKATSIKPPSQMLMLGECGAGGSEKTGRDLLRDSYSIASLGILVLRHTKGVNISFVDGHSAYIKTRTRMPPPYIAEDNPYRYEPFNKKITWKGE